MSTTNIGKYLKTSPDTLRKWIKFYNLKLKPRGYWNRFTTKYKYNSEIFTKENEIVNCRLIIKMNNVRRYYSKINTFQQESQWVDVTTTSFGKKKQRNKLLIVEKEIRYLICKKHQHLNLGKK